MDKMIVSPTNDVVITNDGATILNQLDLVHPAGKMMADLGKAQDIEAGDGTTSVVVLAGSMLAQAEKLLGRGVHPTTITDSFMKVCTHISPLLIAHSYSLNFHHM